MVTSGQGKARDLEMLPALFTINMLLGERIVCRYGSLTTWRRKFGKLHQAFVQRLSRFHAVHAWGRLH
jgi:hypothetical protein